MPGPPVKHLICNVFLAYSCVDDVNTWTVTMYADTGAIIFQAVKSGGDTPEGTYTNNLAGADASPATIDISSVSGSQSAVTDNLLTCQPS